MAFPPGTTDMEPDRHGLCAHVRYALNQIRHHYMEDVTLAQVARTLDRQAEYVGWRFRHETGRSFRQRLAQVRIRHGARLVRHGEKIEAVALLTGYRSKKNFYDQFRRYFGVTPGAYRLRRRRRPAAPHADGR